MKQSCKGLLLFAGLLLITAQSVCLAEDYCSTIYSKIITMHWAVETGFDPNDPNAFDRGHVHLDVSFTSNGWENCIHSEVTGREVEMDKAFLHVNENGRWNIGSVPAGYEFIGITPGQTFWILPDTEKEGLLFPGFGAESDMANLCLWNPGDSRNNADVSDKWIKIRLVKVTGPQDGWFSMWRNSESGPVVFFSTYMDGIDQDDTVYIPAELHCFHSNWAFTKVGLWQIDLELSTVYRCSGLAADINRDCHVNLDDFYIMAGNWLQADCGQTEDPCHGADINIPKDGRVNLSDLLTLISLWLDCAYPGCQS